ncbi:MAG: hypothetical protein ACFFEY_18890 [Candidatus Thorarchaeota archaeon]
MNKNKKKTHAKQINPEKPRFKVMKIIKIERDFDPTKIPLNMRWEVRDFKSLIDMGKKRRKK